MLTYELIAVAVALGCDAFSVAVGVGALGVTKRRIFRLSWHFGLFQFLMPLIGVSIGRVASTLIGKAGHWIAAISLLIIGINMIRQALSVPEEGRYVQDPTKGWSLIILSVSTSIDALVAGFSFGLIGVNILSACTVIGLTAILMTWMGMLTGAGAAKVIGKRAEIFGGLVLIGLAIFFII